jgi:serine/threonine protein kinase
MTPDRWQKVKEIFQAALDRPARERSVFLADACREDEALHREVESLLASHEKEGSFIDSPAHEAAAESILDEKTELKPGQVVGAYEILSFITRGGMGEVYLARDTRLGRNVALKFLPSSFTKDHERLGRFEQEARAISALNHPNILTIHEVGEVDGRHFLATEYVDGQTLRQRLADRNLNVKEGLDIAIQIASAMAAAHVKGIVHRDIKPDNIILRRDGLVKVLDFGLAKLTEPKEGGLEDPTRALVQTMTGTVMGTVGYMSPEQVRGQEVDHRSDIFSFGVVLYEVLSGRRAFIGESNADLMSAILKEEPSELSETNNQVNPGLEKIVRRCLEKEPDRRFQSASDLAFALESQSIISGSLIVSKPGPTMESALTKRHRWPLFLILGIALLAAGAVAGMLIYKNLSKAPAPLYQRLTFGRGTIWKARFAPDGQTVFYSARWNGDPLNVFSVRAGKTESRSLKLGDADLLAVSGSNELAVLRHRQYFAWFISRGTLARLPVDSNAARDLLEDVQEADWSPDGTNLAVVRWVNGRNRLEYPIGKVLYETAGYISHPRISPNGELVAFMDHQVQPDNRGWVVVVDLSGKKTALSGEWSGEEGLAWSPTGDEVWFTASKAGEADGLYAVTLSGRERLIVRMPVRLMLHDISRDGRVLLASYSVHQDTNGQAPGEIKERNLSWLDSAEPSDLSSDGKSSLFVYWREGSGINYAVYLRPTDGSPAIRLGDGHPQQLSPDGKWALTVLNTPPQLVLLPTGAGEAKRLERGPIEQYGGGARWFPDGKRIVFQGREPGHDWRCYIQTIDGGLPQPITPEGTTKTRRGIIVSPDGRFVIALDARHQPFFYPVEGGEAKPISHLDSKDEIVGWSNDGRSLYLAQTEEMPIRVYRFDPSTGLREPLKEVTPTDPAGIHWPNYIFMTPDGKGYLYSVRRTLSDLYLVEGLK